MDTVNHPVFTDGFQNSLKTDKMQYPFACSRMAAVMLPSIHGLCIVQEELKDFFPTLLDFAGVLTSAAPEPARKAGAAMYVALFLQFESSYHRQVSMPPDVLTYARTFMHPFFQANVHFCAVIRPDCLHSVLCSRFPVTTSLRTALSMQCSCRRC